MEWYQKAAEQGNAVAQFNIGYLYEYGLGVQKDQSKAMEWYKKAADGGYIEAKWRLDELELQGDDSVGDSAKKKKRSLFNRIFN
jgi:TPR repeat protein